MRRSQQPIRQKRISAKRWALLGFFLFMGAFTAISRVYDSITIPKVQTTVAKRKSVESVTEGTGTVKVKEKSFYRTEAGLRIGQVMVLPGSQVEEGDILFSYDSQSIADKKEDILRQLEQIDLDIEKEHVSQETYSHLTQAEGAKWELAMAQRELEEGQSEYDKATEEHNKELERLKNQYEDSLSLTEEELWEQQIRNWEAARNSLDAAKSARDRELRAARRTIEDLEEQLNGAESEEEAKELERSLKRAREDMEDLRSSWEDQVTSASFQMDFAESQEDRIAAGQTTAQQARKEAYEAAVKQQEDRLKAARENLENLKKAVERAKWQVTAAQKEDSAAALSEEQGRQLSALTVRGLENNRKLKQKELMELEKLAEQGGQVLAKEHGVAVDVEITAGKTAVGEELITLAVGGSRFEGTFKKEEQQLFKGDIVTIAIPGTPKTKEAVIDSINLLGDGEGIFQADLGDLELALGTVTQYQCRKQSDIFAKVIPVEGLRKDMKGYYCLVARSRPSILGEEFRAERVEVRVICQGSEEVAVDGSVFEEDRVIIRENQTISQGDRVRPVS